MARQRGVQIARLARDFLTFCEESSQSCQTGARKKGWTSCLRPSGTMGVPAVPPGGGSTCLRRKRNAVSSLWLSPWPYRLPAPSLPMQLRGPALLGCGGGWSRSGARESSGGGGRRAQHLLGVKRRQRLRPSKEPASIPMGDAPAFWVVSLRPAAGSTTTVHASTLTAKSFLRPPRLGRNARAGGQGMMGIRNISPLGLPSKCSNPARSVRQSTGSEGDNPLE
jgi:hypothetical protein